MTPSYEDMLAYAIAQTRRNMATVTDFPELTGDGGWICVDGRRVDGRPLGGPAVAGLCTHGRPHAGGGGARLGGAPGPRQHDTTTHDMGFLFELSHVLGAQITGDALLKTAGHQRQPQALIQRFNEKGKYIPGLGRAAIPPTGAGARSSTA